MAQVFAEKLKKVREEAQIPYKTQIMVHKLKRIMQEPVKTEAEKKAFQEKSKQEDKILSEGLSAVASIGESTFAVSTQKRFRDWAEHKGLRHEEFSVDRKDWNKKEPFQRDGKFFVPYEEFRQTGYGAWHIGGAIDGLRQQGRDVLIVDGSRNRRFLFKEVKPSELEKKV